MGRNVVVLFALNGVFYHSVNGPIAAWAEKAWPGSAWAVLATGAVVTALSLALCVPAIHWLAARLPWAIGRRRVS